ncbi:hypothetical protein Misp06_01079 [Microbulbifer sp. NBRC 101763]
MVSNMWNLSKSKVSNGYHFTINNNREAVTFYEVLKSLRDNAKFRNFLISSLQAIPYQAYRWETPGFTKKSLQGIFEFVVLDAPSLDQMPNSRPFEAYIRDTSKSVVWFQNLGKDATVVVPSNQETAVNYCHLASFTNTAPSRQQHELWSTVGGLGLKLASNNPVWLSTAGGGVAWLHIRFDSRPKYYHYTEFRKPPNK